MQPSIIFFCLKETMKKTILLLLLLTGKIWSAEAQIKTSLRILTEGTVPFCQHESGFGFNLEGLYKLSRSSGLSLSGGISKFKSAKIEKEKITTRLVPFLLGYKRSWNKIYIQPQVGFGEMSGKIYMQGDYSRPSIAAVFAAFGAGLSVTNFDFGVRYQMSHGIENASSGLWHDRNFHYTAAFISYKLF